MMLSVEQMKTIKKEIKRNFFSHNRPASNFGDKGLMNVCLDIFADYNKTYCVLLMNDAGVPPVKAVLMLYRDFYNLAPDKRFSMQDSQNVGALMTFVFKEVLGYEIKKEKARVGMYGIASGRVFVNHRITENPAPEQDTENDSLTLTYETPEWGNNFY